MAQDKLKGLLYSLMSSTFTDGETIAKSAVSMVIERSQDLDHNPVIALVMCEALCKMAIDDYASHTKHGVPGMSAEEGLKILREVIGKGVNDQYKEHKHKLDV